MSIKDHIQKCNDTITFLKIGDFIRDNLYVNDKLLLYDINIYIKTTTKLIKNNNRKFVEKIEKKMMNKFYDKIDVKKLDIEELYIYKLLVYFKILCRMKSKIS
jgi:hypothetical protein